MIILWPGYIIHIRLDASCPIGEICLLFFRTWKREGQGHRFLKEDKEGKGFLRVPKKDR